jgi:hypothetical protein
MNRTSILYCFILLCLVVLSVGATSVYAQNEVTFQVNMKIKMMEQSFLPGSGDIVSVKGDFNGWGGTDTLKDLDGDSVYTGTISLPEGAIAYKFMKTLRLASDWEGVDNRTYNVAAGAQSIPVTYFDNDSVYNAPVTMVPVTFQVRMGVKMQEGTFLPDSGDIVRVAGNFNAWGSSTDTLKDPDHDSIYTGAVNIAEGSSIQYKFLKTARGGIDWENSIGDNRTYTVPTGGGTIAPAYFDNDALVSVPTTGNILWQVDMTAFSQLGWFRPDLGDSLQVRGGMNSWGGTPMSANLFQDGVFEANIPFSGFTYDDIPHKFFTKFDTTSAFTRFPGFETGNRDEYQYDHPADRGDGNVIFNVGTGGDISTPLRYFGSVSPYGIIPAGDTVDVTISVNMGPATRYSVPLDLATDTVKLAFEEGVWRATQQRLQGSFPRYQVMTQAAPGDSMYSITFKVVGPTHYAILYRFQYTNPGGTAVTDQSGSLGGSNVYQSRYIQPVTMKTAAKSSATVWPRFYSMPTDTWAKTSPFVAEVPPFDIINGVEEVISGVPQAYVLSQNYPNPFNPVTRIRYSIPEAGLVTLKVFNILGQQVASLVNQEQKAGNYVALFEANKFPSGVYFYRLESGSFRQVMKMVLMK